MEKIRVTLALGIMAAVASCTTATPVPAPTVTPLPRFYGGFSCISPLQGVQT